MTRKEKRSVQKRRRSRTVRTIRVVKGGGSDVSTRNLEVALAQMLHAEVTGVDARISFMFLRKILNELLRRRREETASEDIKDIIRELCEGAAKSKDGGRQKAKKTPKKKVPSPAIEKCCGGKQCAGGCDHATADDLDNSSTVSLTSADILSEDDLLVPDSGEEWPVQAFESDDFEIDDFSRLEDAAAEGQQLTKSNDEQDERWGNWPL